jgi:hypothetical protein
MVGRLIVGCLAIFLFGLAARASADLRPSKNRPDVFEIGDPIPISTDLLQREAASNNELREYMDSYGYPDYAEIQEIDVQEPFVPYEVRLYYLRRNKQLAFGRVYVAPSVTNFGAKKYEGPIGKDVLKRISAARTTTPAGDIAAPPETRQED